MPYKIITICGSTRFKEIFDSVAKELILKGYIVLTCNCFGRVDNDPRIWENKTMLDDMHFRKIDMSEAIFVVNKGGYIGESTRNEINYALSQKKAIFYLEPSFKRCGTCGEELTEHGYCPRYESGSCPHYLKLNIKIIEPTIYQLKESLLDMLNQHGENWALSSNQEACMILGHPFPPAINEDGSNPYYPTDRCYCGEQKKDSKINIQVRRDIGTRSGKTQRQEQAIKEYEGCTDCPDKNNCPEGTVPGSHLCSQMKIKRKAKEINDSEINLCKCNDRAEFICPKCGTGYCWGCLQAHDPHMTDKCPECNTPFKEGDANGSSS